MEHTEAQIEELSRRLAATEKENAGLRRKLDSKRVSPRNVWAIVIIVVGLIAILPADILLWANRTITNTDQYVATVGPIIKDASVQKAITQYTTTSIYRAVNIQQTVANLLPDQAKPLAGPVTGQVKNYINSSVAGLVSSAQFANVWVNFNKTAQQAFMQRASNSKAPPTITVDQLYHFISGNLQGTNLAILGGHTLPSKVGSIQLITVPWLAQLPHYLAAFDGIRWLLLGLAIGCMILAIAVAENRRRIALIIGTGWMGVVVLGVILVRVTRAILLGQIHDQTYYNAAVSIWQAMLKPLYLQSLVLFVLGAVLVVVAWLLGPARVAIGFRGWGQNLLGGWQYSIMPDASEMGWVKFLRRNHSGFLWAIVVVTFFVLLLLTPLTLLTLSLVLVGAVIVWLVLEFFVAGSYQKLNRTE